jgi:hypothetical protein
MEDVPAVSARPYDPARPVLCMDEKPYQLLDHARGPLPARPGHAPVRTASTSAAARARSSCGSNPCAVDVEFRQLSQRTRIDWVGQVKQLLSVDYPDAAAVVLVIDLNTQGIASLYEGIRTRGGLRSGPTP